MLRNLDMLCIHIGPGSHVCGVSSFDHRAHTIAQYVTTVYSNAIIIASLQDHVLDYEISAILLCLVFGLELLRHTVLFTPWSTYIIHFY